MAVEVSLKGKDHREGHYPELEIRAHGLARLVGIPFQVENVVYDLEAHTDVVADAAQGVRLPFLEISLGGSQVEAQSEEHRGFSDDPVQVASNAQPLGERVPHLGHLGGDDPGHGGGEHSRVLRSRAVGNRGKTASKEKVTHQHRPPASMLQVKRLMAAPLFRPIHDVIVDKGGHV